MGTSLCLHHGKKIGSFCGRFLVLEVTKAKVNKIFQIHGSEQILSSVNQNKNGSLSQKDMYFELLMLVMNCSEHLPKHLAELLARQWS